MVWPVNIGDNVVFFKQTHNSSGAASSADSLPEFFVFAGTSTSFVKGATMFHNTLGDGLYQASFLVQSSTYPTNVYGSIITYAAVGGITAADVTPFFIMPTTVARVGNNTVSISSGAITNLTFTASAVDATALADGSITASKIASSAIGSSQIAAGAISNAKLATDCIGSSQIAAGAITNADLSIGCIGSSQIAAAAFVNAAFAIDCIGSSQIAAGAIDNAALATGCIGSSQIAAGAITNAAIASSAIGSSQFEGAFGDWVGQFVSAQVSSTATTSVFITNLTSTRDSFYNGNVLVFTSGTNVSQASPIIAYTGASKQITVSRALATVPTTNDTFTLVPLIGSTASTDVNIISVSAGAITNAGLATGCIGSSQIAAGALTEAAFTSSAIGSSALAASAINKISTSINTWSSGVQSYLATWTSAIQTQFLVTSSSAQSALQTWTSGVQTYLATWTSGVQTAIISTMARNVWSAIGSSYTSSDTLGYHLWSVSTGTPGGGSTDVNVVSISAGVLAPVWDTTSTDHLIAGTVGAKLAALSTTTGGGSTDVNVVSISAGVINEAAFTSSAIGSSALAASAINKISTSINTWSSGIQSYLATWTSAIQSQLLVTSSSAQSALQTWTSGIQTAVLSSMPTVAGISTAISVMTGADPAGVFHPSTHWMSKLDWLANEFLSRQTMNRVSGLTTIYNASTSVIATFTAADDGTVFTRPKRT